MDRVEAERRADELNRSDPGFRWIARAAPDGAWEIVRVRVPGPAGPGRLTASQPGKQPPPPDEHPMDLPGGVPPWAAGGA